MLPKSIIKDTIETVGNVTKSVIDTTKDVAKKLDLYIFTTHRK
jgi:hypothetical protein